MSERDDDQRSAVGAGAPADPDHFAHRPSLGGDDGAAAASDRPAADGTSPEPEGDRPLAGDAVEAVVAFVDNLVVETGSEVAPSDDAPSHDAARDVPGTDDSGRDESGTGESGNQAPRPGKLAG